MPAVTVLPVRCTTPNSQIVEKMSTQERVRGIDEAAVPRNEKEGSTPTTTETVGEDSTPDKGKVGSEGDKADDADRKEGSSEPGTVSPSQSTISYPTSQSMYQTPQGYYLAHGQSQVTPEPPSPAGPGATPVYDVGSIFPQQGAGFHNSPFAASHQYGMNPSQQPQPPQSPSHSTSGSIPPASPLFQPGPGQATAGLLVDGAILQRGTPLSPGPPYLASPVLGPSSMYPNMGAYAGPTPNNTTSNNSPDGFSGWGDSRNPQNHSLPPNSPQMNPQGIPMPYVPGMPPRTTHGSRGSSYSFEDAMLPPSAESQEQNQQQQEQNSHHGYGVPNQNSGLNAPVSFAPPQPWAYGAPPPDMQFGPASPLQPRPTMSYPGLSGGPPRHHQMHHHMAPYGGQFYPATSPGPPIQTTPSNKGPDGANLFIFHIPNHFTNVDMYNLFCPYGNLLSVRIMVEKDTGRSRGFGFVSYDSPDAAALAIKELNGFTIGNKRLKVQHKQIRSSDQQQDRTRGNSNNAGYDNMGGGQHGSYGRGRMSPSLPPSGPMAINAPWYNVRAGQMGYVDSTSQPESQNAEEGTSTGVPDNNPSSGPLASLEPLRQNLPDVGGNGEH